MPPRQQPHTAPDLQINTGPGDADELRRRAPSATPPHPMPPRNVGEDGHPAGGGFTPTEDGGNQQHPIHDDDLEDNTPSDYEREIDRLDVASRAGID